MTTSEAYPIRYEGVEVAGSKRKGYTVSWYEWQIGHGRDCGLNYETRFGTREEASEYAAELRSRNGK